MGHIDMFLPIQRVNISRKQPKAQHIGLSGQMKGSAGHFWPAGRMLCMPALNKHDMPKESRSQSLAYSV